MVAHILSPPQRAALFDPPSDPAAIERLYTLGPDDLVEVFRRRRPGNRIGYAVQLGYLRHPGRAIEPGEVPSAAMLTVLAAQIGCAPDAFADYAARDTTLREHRAAIERRLGLRTFERADRGMVFVTASEVAASTDRCDAIVAAMVERLRGASVVLPLPAVLERIALVARAEARRQAFARLGRDLIPEQVERLDALLRVGGTPTRSPLAWIRDWPEAPGAGNLKAVVERLDHVRALGIEAARSRRIHASRYTVIAREAAIMTAQHLTRLEGRRRLATLVAFAIEMEVALTDAAILMVEKLVAGMFRRADRTRSERLIDQARLFRDTARLHIRLGRTLLDARSTGRNALALVDERIGWPALEQSLRAAEELTRPGEDGLDEVVERYPAVRRFLPTFLAAFRFRTARAGDPLLGAVELLRTFYTDGRTILPRKAPVSFLKPKWRRIVMPTDGAFNRRAWEIAVLVHLRDRFASGAVWVDGSRAYRTLDDYLLPARAFATMRAEGQLGLAVSGTASDWIAAHRDRLRQRMDEVEAAAAQGTLPDATIEDGRLPPCLIGIEACASSHYWARELVALGHDVKLMPAQYVKPYVKRGKNDAADAEAICEAVTRPTMRFVGIKTPEQQSAMMLHRVRMILNRQRTQISNAVRAHLAEFGIVAPIGRNGIDQLLDVIADPTDERVPADARVCLEMLATQLRMVKEQILENDRRVLASARETELGRRLMEIPGVGPLLASAIVATVPDPAIFRSGRNLAAWIGLVPRQNSSGGKERLGGITKAGHQYLRQMLIVGAMAVVRYAERNGAKRPWLVQLLARRKPKVAAVALANKNARMIWAMMASGEHYREPQIA